MQYDKSVLMRRKLLKILSSTGVVPNQQQRYTTGQSCTFKYMIDMLLYHIFSYM